MIKIQTSLHHWTKPRALQRNTWMDELPLTHTHKHFIGNVLRAWQPFEMFHCQKEVYPEMSAFSIALDKVSCQDKAVTPPTSDPCCCFLLSTSNSSMASEEAVWPLHASHGHSSPCIFVLRTERQKAQSPQHQLSNGVLEALTKQQQEESFFFLTFPSHSLHLTYSLSVCQSGWGAAVPLCSNFTSWS